MWKYDDIRCSVSVPTTLCDTLLFDARGNAWNIKKSETKLFGIIPRTSYILCGQGSMRWIIRDLVETSIKDTLRLWKEKHGIPMLEEMGKKTHPCLEEFIKRSRFTFKKNLIASLGNGGEECLQAVLKDLIDDIQKIVTKKRAQEKSAREESSGILPQGTRFHSHLDTGYNTYDIFCIEQPPQKRTIRIFGKHKMLAFPWIYFLIVFSGARRIEVSIFYRNAPLQSMDDTLYIPNLPNISPSDYKCCLGEFPSTDLTMHNWDKIFLSSFWGGVFRDDGTGYADQYKKDASRIPEVKTISVWEENSKKDPLFMLKLAWRPLSSLQEMITKLVCYYAFQDEKDSVKEISHDWNIIRKQHLIEFTQHLREELSSLCENFSSAPDASHIMHEYVKKILENIETKLTHALQEMSEPIIKEITSSTLNMVHAKERGETPT